MNVQIKEVHEQEKLGDQGFYYFITMRENFLRQLQKQLHVAVEIFLRKKTITNIFEELNESNVPLEHSTFLNKKGTNSRNSIRPSANLVVRQNRSHYRLSDNVESHNWKTS